MLKRITTTFLLFLALSSAVLAEVFQPLSDTLPITATTTSSAAQALTVPAAPNVQVRIYNAGPATAFFVLGGASVAAASVTTSIPIPAGAIEVMSLGTANNVRIISASGGATVYFTVGRGF